MKKSLAGTIALSILAVGSRFEIETPLRNHSEKKIAVLTHRIRIDAEHQNASYGVKTVSLKLKRFSVRVRWGKLRSAAVKKPKLSLTMRLVGQVAGCRKTSRHKKTAAFINENGRFGFRY